MLQYPLWRNRREMNRQNVYQVYIAGKNYQQKICFSGTKHTDRQTVIVTHTAYIGKG